MEHQEYTLNLYHLDLKICMFTEEYLRGFLNRLLKMGFGGVVVEIDNKLRFPSHPDFAAPDALDAQSWHCLVRYAKELGLTIYPLIQTLGHMEHVLTPVSTYHMLAEIPGQNYLVCPSKEETLAFVSDLIRDVWEVFDNPERIHLGGDECRGLGSCPICAGRSASELVSAYMGKLASYAQKFGMKPEFWADTVLGRPDILSTMQGDIRFVDWDYNRIEPFEYTVGHCRCGTELKRQEVSLIDARSHGINTAELKECITQNMELMEEFTELWAKSVTYESLEFEKEIKFRRDIRVIEDFVG
jgi:hypothetical protein